MNRQSVMALTTASRIAAVLAILAGLQAGALTPIAAQPGPEDPAAKAPPSGPGPAHAGLIEEQTFLTVKGPSGAYRLEAFIVRPARAQGRLPIALITHGKQRLPAEMALMRAELMLPQARDLAHRGFLAVAVVRRGFGRSGGTPGVATNAPYAKCSVADLQRYFLVELDDIEAALHIVGERADADPTRAIAIGGSVGGGAVPRACQPAAQGAGCSSQHRGRGAADGRQWRHHLSVRDADCSHGQLRRRRDAHAMALLRERQRVCPEHCAPPERGLCNRRRQGRAARRTGAGAGWSQPDGVRGRAGALARRARSVPARARIADVELRARSTPC